MSDDTANAIDMEIRKFIDSNYARAKQILVDHMEQLHAMADALMKYETIDSDQIQRIMKGMDPGAPGSWSGDTRVPPPSKPAAPTGGAVASPPPPVAPKPASQS
jgi:cell division protease FtsH